MTSTATREQLHRLNDRQGMLVLLILLLPSGTQRIVNDTRAWTIGGVPYLACPFRVKMPNLAQGQPGRAQIEIDNVGREIVDELEQLPPGASLRATLRQVSRAQPTVVDYEFTAALSNVVASVNTVSASLGNDDLLRAPAVKVRFDPTITPELFST